jgi:parvulin-like peptidyl-prolyl isomerase
VQNCAARLATAVLLTFAVRAAWSQQQIPDGPRGNPYAPQPNQPYAPPSNLVPRSGPPYPLPPPPQPTINQALRYSLPNTGPALPPAAAPQAQAPPAAAPQAVLFQPGQIVARVGDKTILYADVAPTVEMILVPVLAKAKSDAERESIEAQREALTKSIVQQVVQNKMLLVEFERDIPAKLKNDPKERATQEAKINKSVRQSFEQSLAAAREKTATASQDDIDKLIRQDPTIMRLALLMRDHHLESPGELDMALRQYGTSLAQQVKDYGEHMMGIEAVRRKLDLGKSAKKKEVTHQELLDYYQGHVADYYIPAKARFEILTVKFSNFSDRAAAQRAIVEMGNAVFFGAPFAAVAKKHSQEPRASDGGYYDWVSPGGLASKPIDRAVFSLQVDRLSQIIEDDNGYHIVHVLERKEAGQVSFQEAQPDIKIAIENQRRAAEQQKYLADLRARSKVWTIFDPPTDVAAQPTSNTRR